MTNRLIRSGAAQISPANPGTPPRPGYTSYETVTVTETIPSTNGYWAKVTNSSTNGDLSYDGTKYLWVGETTTAQRTITVPVYHPPVAGTPGTPEKRTYVPPQGWTAFAHSVESIVSGYAQFRVGPDVAGVAIGLAPLSSPKVGYNHIPQGLLFTGGHVRNLKTNEDYGTYDASTTFYIDVSAGMMSFSTDAAPLWYGAAQTGVGARLHLTAAMYGAQDYIDSPSLVEYDFGANSSALLPTLSVASGTAPYAASAATLPALVALSGVVNRSRVGIPGLTAQSSNKVVATSRAVIPIIECNSYGGAWGIERNNESFATLFAPQAMSIGLTGETGGGDVALPSLVGISADREYGQSAAVMPTFGAYSHDAPNDMAFLTDSFGMRVGLSSKALVPASISPTLSLGLIVYSAEIVADESIEFGMGVEVAVSSSTDETVAIYPSIGFGVEVDVPGAFIDTWVMNLKTGGTTRYTNYPFDNVANIGGAHFGSSYEGVFVLEGDTDSGAAIGASIDYGQQNFGTKLLKRVEQVYLAAASTKPMAVKITSEGASYTYKSAGHSPELQVQRAVAGRGLRANFFGLEIHNTDGGDFHLNSVEALVAPATRRV